MTTDSRLRDRRITWILRLGACLCFLGHGAFGLIGKSAWIPYFGVVGISEAHAWQLEPIVGSVDILLATLVLLRPRPIVLAYMTAWAIWTALLRPLSGDSAWEAVERAGNYGVPFAFLVAAGWSREAGWWFRGIAFVSLSEDSMRRVRGTLVVATSLLLIGHGMLALVAKPGLVAHAQLLDPDHAATLARVFGWSELILASAIVVRPTMTIALTIAVWKLATESLFLFAGAPAWEVVERAGSYAAPLALAVIFAERARTNRADNRQERRRSPAKLHVVGTE
ncbi:MAG TPA: hypothetical protein VK636_03260 [Gemmatimonadaceae bacterium]|nr:hypothetical protein [Gemmatimonadaceae bacterium]